MLAPSDVVGIPRVPHSTVDDAGLARYIRQEGVDFDPAWLRASPARLPRRKARGRWIGRVRSWFASLTGLSPKRAAVPGVAPCTEPCTARS